MKIVYCINGTFNSGGMERVLANKTNFLVDEGYEIYIITTDQQHKENFFEFDRRIKHIDLDINYFENNNRNLLYKTLYYVDKQKKHKKKLRQILNDIKPDIVISMFDNDVSFLHKINKNSIKLLEIHFSKYKRIQYNRKGFFKIVDILRTKYDTYLVKKYNKFIVLTNEDKQLWGELSNISVIPNANSFECEDSANLINKQAIAVGRYDYQKGFDELILAWSLIVNENPSWNLKIYGDGPLKQDYIHLINKLNLNKHIELCPPTNKIKKAYLDSSILVMTSNYEGFGMVLIEAQNCGLPLISYDCKCGPKDIITDGVNGFLVPLKNREKLAERLNILMQDYELRKILGSNAKEQSKNFQQSIIMKKWLDLFDEVLSKNN